MPRVPTPLEVITVLNRAKISFILVGLHGVAGWMSKPRATQDVDVLVASRQHNKAVKALLTAFPHLERVDLEVVTRLLDPETEEVVIDVMKPTELYRAAFLHTKTVLSEGQTYRIPSLEMALAMKFAPMISLNRKDADKLQDAHDFMYMIEKNSAIDLDKLAKLGELVYPGGGAEIVEKVRQVRAGEKLIL